jgi:glucose/arabinose dehydrogenase
MNTSTRLRGILAFATCAVATGAQADMVHRWSFNQPAGAASSGTTLTDSISGIPAVVRGNGGIFTGTGLTLPGTTTGNQTAAAIAAYLDLPNGLISSKTDLTLEAWIIPHSSKNWQRLFDFGRANVTAGAGAATGEIIDTTTAPGNYTGYDNLVLSLNTGTTLGNHLLEARIGNGPKLAASQNLSGSTAAGTEYHYVLTVTDNAGTHGTSGCRAAWYRNGVLQKTLDLNFHLGQIADVNNWIGRSQYGADSNSHITINELRLHNHAMDASQVSASFSAGANPNYPVPVAQADSATLHLGQKVRIAVTDNDTGPLSPPTVRIVQPPQSGTAVPDNTGGILYHHTAGQPESDSFTYQITGPGGTSQSATVTVHFSPALRIVATALKVPSAPPPTAYQLVSAFNGPTFSQPVCLASPPGDTRRLFVCQKGGLIKLIPDVTAANVTAPVFLDLPALLTARGETISTSGEQGLLGLAFHPDHATNGFFYVFYSVTSGGSVKERVSRFRVQAGNPDAADPASELILLNQTDPASNHNGGGLQFGPDGYLYVSLGDGGNQNDSLNNSQRIDLNFFSGILRIDVDKKPDSLEPNAHAAVPTDSGTARYSVPPDNPFVGATSFNGLAVTPSNVRTEFWAVGLRNPWRFSFDPQTGELWCADVGQNLYEEIDLITRGANAGWAYREGLHAGPKTVVGTPVLLDPVYEYPHSGGDSNFTGSSVTGGLVYRGSRFSGLIGKYLFADYVSGHLWSLARNSGAPPTVTRLTGQGGLVAFGTDSSNGDVLAANYSSGVIQRLVTGPAGGSFPATLGATGLFADLTDLSPTPGVLPYEPNLTFWSDHAVKRRWFALPDPAAQMAWSRDGRWTFPDGAIWVKHFDMEMTRGDAGTKKRLETRLLVKNSTGAYGVSYRWNDAQTEATLVPDEGVEFDLSIVENGSPRTQRWQIPSRASCMICHTPQAGHALSFDTRQINRPFTMNGFSGNQLELLHAGGYFANTPESPNGLPRHLRPNESAYSVEARVRSYLAVNCAYCHQTGGSASPAAWDGRAHLTLAETGLVNGAATNNGGNPDNRLIVPGDTTHSVVLNRVAAANGFTRMPPLATSELDHANIALLQEWIGQSLPGRLTYDQWRLAHFGSTSSPAGEPDADSDGDRLTNREEFIANTDPLDPGSFLSSRLSTDGSNVTITFNVPEGRSVLVETSTDLVGWTLWNVPGNDGLGLAGGPVSFSGPASGSKQFFRLRMREN